MISKTITYEDFDGNQVTEQAYFHINETEIAELYSNFGEIGAMINQSMIEKNPSYFINAIRNLVRIAYGQKLPDGRFIKFDGEGRRLGDYFIGTEAFAELINGLSSEGSNIQEFMMGMFSNSIRKRLSEAITKNPELLNNPEAALNSIT